MSHRIQFNTRANFSNKPNASIFSLGAFSSFPLNELAYLKDDTISDFEGQ